MSTTREVHTIKVRSLGCDFCGFGDDHVEATIEVTAGLSDGVISVNVFAESDNAYSECTESAEEPIEFTLKDLERVPIDLLEAALVQAKECK